MTVVIPGAGFGGAALFISNNSAALMERQGTLPPNAFVSPVKGTELGTPPPARLPLGPASGRVTSPVTTEATKMERTRSRATTTFPVASLVAAREGARPGESRGFLGRIGGAIGGFIGGGIPGAIGGFIGGGGGGRNPINLAPQQPCGAGFRSDGRGGCVPVLGAGRRGVAIPFAPRRPSTPTRRQEPGNFASQAVVGQFGVGLEPEFEMMERAFCLPGMVLGMDGLCYNRGAITNKQRKWPKGRQPLLTGGERNAITRAAGAARKIERTTKQLQRMGMMKKPGRRPAQKMLPPKC